MALQFFTIVSKSPKDLNIHKNESTGTDNITLLAISQLWPTKTWFSLFERAQYQIEKLKSYAKPGSFQVIRSQEELQKFYEERKKNQNVVGGIIGLEGAHAIEEDLPAQMDALFQEGVRMMAPTHFFDNKIAGSAHGENKSGLTDLGRAFVRMANEKGIIIDLAHASEPTIREALALSSKPMVVSHTGLRGHCDNPRNLADEYAKAIVAKGGLIAIGFWPTAVCGSSTESVAEAIAYAIQLLGEDNVAIGSDFDGAVEVPFDASKMIWLVQKLIEQDLSVEAIHKVMGMNQLRFLQNNLPK